MDNYGYNKDEKGHVPREHQPAEEHLPSPEQYSRSAVQQPPPTAEQLSKEIRMWGMFCHLAALSAYVGIPFGNVIGPLIIWLIKREEHPFIDEQGKRALNFHISMAIYGIAAFILMFVIIGFFLLAGIAILSLVMIIINSIKANNGEITSYPLSIQFIK